MSAAQSPTLRSAAETTVSVSVTSYNNGRFLARALDSALSQTRRPAEVILVDDGSTDETPDVAASFGHHIHYIRTVNRGVAAARNTAWRSTTGDLVAFLDGDDVWLECKLERQVEEFRRDPRVGLVYCDTMRTDPDENPIDPWSDHFPPVRGDALIPMLRQNRPHTSTVIIPRVVLEKLGGFDQTLPGWEDIDLWTRIAADWRYAYVPEVLAKYRMLGGGLSQLPLALTHGRRITAERMFRRLAEEGRAVPERAGVLAEIYADIGVAYYLVTDMAAARSWIRRAWRSDLRSLARRRSAETYAKTFLGRSIVARLRRLRGHPGRFSAEVHAGWTGE